MKTRFTVALAMFAGIGLGAVAVQGLHAQALVRNDRDPRARSCAVPRIRVASSGG